MLKAIHNHFQEFCENLRPFVLKKFIHNFTKLLIRIKTVHWKLFRIDCEQAGQGTGMGCWVILQTGRSGDRNKFLSQMCYVLSHRVVNVELRTHKRLQPVQPIWQSGMVRTRNPKQESEYPFELKYLDRIQLNTKFKTPATWFRVTVLVLLVK